MKEKACIGCGRVYVWDWCADAFFTKEDGIFAEVKELKVSKDHSILAHVCKCGEICAASSVGPQGETLMQTSDWVEVDQEDDQENNPPC